MTLLSGPAVRDDVAGSVWDENLAGIHSSRFQHRPDKILTLRTMKKGVFSIHRQLKLEEGRLFRVHLQAHVFSHVSGIAKRWDASGTPLMETIAARSAVESLKEQAAARLAVSQREECFADKVVRNAGREGRILFENDPYFFAFDSADIGIPMDFQL